MNDISVVMQSLLIVVAVAMKWGNLRKTNHFKYLQSQEARRLMKDFYPKCPFSLATACITRHFYSIYRTVNLISSWEAFINLSWYSLSQLVPLELRKSTLQFFFIPDHLYPVMEHFYLDGPGFFLNDPTSNHRGNEMKMMFITGCGLQMQHISIQFNTTSKSILEERCSLLQYSSRKNWWRGASKALCGGWTTY